MNDVVSISVRVAHQDAMISAGLSAILKMEAAFSVCESRIDGGELSSEGRSYDVLLTDYDSGIQHAVKQKCVSIPPGRRLSAVLIYTSISSEADVRYAIRMGVRGYLAQGCQVGDVVAAVKALSLGSRFFCPVATKHIAAAVEHPDLTSRQVEILKLIVAGKSNKSIANLLGLTVGTVKTHISAILAKLDVSSRTHAASVALERGLVSSGLVRSISPKWAGNQLAVNNARLESPH